MTQDEIIEMAIENTINGLNFNQEGLIRFANLVSAKEREACAKEADEYVNQVFEHNFSKLIAHNIRARGQA
jgi:uncharacterized protein YggL (DUF469 family)